MKKKKLLFKYITSNKTCYSKKGNSVKKKKKVQMSLPYRPTRLYSVVGEDGQRYYCYLKTLPSPYRHNRSKSIFTYKLPGKRGRKIFFRNDFSIDSKKLSYDVLKFLTIMLLRLLVFAANDLPLTYKLWRCHFSYAYYEKHHKHKRELIPGHHALMREIHLGHIGAYGTAEVQIALEAEIREYIKIGALNEDVLDSLDLTSALTAQLTYETVMMAEHMVYMRKWKNYAFRIVKEHKEYVSVMTFFLKRELSILETFRDFRKKSHRNTLGKNPYGFKYKWQLNNEIKTLKYFLLALNSPSSLPEFRQLENMHWRHYKRKNSFWGYYLELKDLALVNEFYACKFKLLLKEMEEQKKELENFEKRKGLIRFYWKKCLKFVKKKLDRVYLDCLEVIRKNPFF